MDKKPHSRNKTVSSGSANVARGSKIQTGGRPVGGQSSRPGSSSGFGHPSGGQSYSGGSSGFNHPSNGHGFPGSGMYDHGGQGYQGNRSTGSFSTNVSAGKSIRTPGCLIKIVLLVLALIIISSLLRSCAKGFGGSSWLFDSTPSYTQTPGSSSYSGQDSSSSSSGFFFDEFEDEINGSSGSSANLSVAAGARAKRVLPLGNGKDVVTVMVYMCGTDLESQGGMATKDLQEMLSAAVSDKVNIIIQTGGCRRWRNDVISSSVNQIYKVSNGKLQQLENNFGSASMTNPDTLSEFIGYCKENYPADRNFLILWDHGGGSISGYGYDEKYQGKASLTLDKLNKALSDADCVFDAICFDACLMATYENALVCNQYADYLIASEETEPGTGWYYTNWISQLSKNTSMPTVNLAQIIIDDFVSTSMRASSGSRVSLSVIDLAELQGTVPDVFNRFSSSTCELIENNDYKAVSNARAKARQFSQSSRINQVDLIDLAARIGTNESKALVKALASCVKYNRTNISDANGISIYFPYESLSSFNNAIALYDSLGIDDEYTKCIRSFASVESAGQYTAYSAQPYSYSSSSGSSGSYYGSDSFLDALLNAYAGNTYGSSSGSSYGSSGSIYSPTDSLFGSYSNSSGSASSGNSINMMDVLGLLSGFRQRSMPGDLSWVDTDLISSYAENISHNFIDPGRICITERNGVKVLSLTDEEWELIQSVELNVFADDGHGYIDLGLDNTFEWFSDSDMLLDYDGTWLTVNGQPVEYYMVSDTEDAYGSWTTVGRIPAVLNSRLVELQVVFDDKNPEGIITGAFPLYHDETSTIAKGDIEIREGDTLQFVCDYYKYNGDYSDSYLLGKPFTVGAKGLTLANMSLSGIGKCSVTYRLTDIYGNEYWTPAFEYSVG